MFRSLVLLNRSWHEVGACCGESLGLGGEGIECLLGNVVWIEGGAGEDIRPRRVWRHSILSGSR